MPSELRHSILLSNADEKTKKAALKLIRRREVKRKYKERVAAMGSFARRV